MQVTLIKPLHIIISFFLLGISNVSAQNTFWATKAGNDSNNFTNVTDKNPDGGFLAATKFLIYYFKIRANSAHGVASSSGLIVTNGFEII